MAKRSNESPSTDKAKVRVFFAELEGGNESVQEALRTMASAMSRPVRVVTEQGNARLSHLLEDGSLDTQIDYPEEENNGETVAESAPPSTPRKPRGSAVRDRNTGLKLVPDLNFRPPDEPTLKDFNSEKRPANDIEAIALYVYFLEKKMLIDKISAAHVMTAFKDVGKPIPADLRQAIRNIKNTKGWLKFAELDDIKMTTQGDNFIEHEIGLSK